MTNGKTPADREAIFEQARTALAKEGFDKCYKAPPGCGSAVIEYDE